MLLVLIIATDLARCFPRDARYNRRHVFSCVFANNRVVDSFEGARSPLEPPFHLCIMVFIFSQCVLVIFFERLQFICPRIRYFTWNFSYFRHKLGHVPFSGTVPSSTGLFIRIDLWGLLIGAKGALATILFSYKFRRQISSTMFIHVAVTTYAPHSASVSSMPSYFLLLRAPCSTRLISHGKGLLIISCVALRITGPFTLNIPRISRVRLHVQ